MPKSRNDKLQGTLTLLVLRTLDVRGPLHGYALCEHIRSVSEEILQVEEGSLYPALHKGYSIAARGRKQLADEHETWSRLTQGVARVLRYSS